MLTPGPDWKADVTVETPEDFQGMRAAGALVRRVFEQMKRAAVAGVSTAELDALAAAMLSDAGAVSAPKLFYDFPGHTCISVNEHAAHGIPGHRRVKADDMINIDVSAELDGYVADMGESFVVGGGRRAQHEICAAVREAVGDAIAQVKPGRSLNVLGKAAQQVAQRRGYQIIRNLGSHGVGRSIHEEPSYVPVDNPAETRRLRQGMVFTIEPFFTTGVPWVEELTDGWTLAVGKDQLVAQFEHTIMVTHDGVEILTA
jgi:methionyl aminopeptidase